jgi:C1A family cysteine protease
MEDYILNVSVEDPGFNKKLNKVKTGLHRAKASDRPLKYDRAPSPIYDQGSLGSCVGFAVKSAISPHHNDDLSALYIYRQAQFHDSKIGENYSGTTLSGACRALVKKGVCREDFYPYRTDINSPLPSGLANQDASLRKAKDYFTMWWDDVNTIKDLILSGFNPAIAIYVHSEFYNIDNNGFLKNEENYIKSSKRGGHAMCLRGWDHVNGKLFWKIQNSWGKNRGGDGCIFISHELISKIGKGLYVSVYDEDSMQYKKMTFFDKLVYKMRLAVRYIINKII